MKNLKLLLKKWLLRLTHVSGSSSIADKIQSQEFYELMQQYRHAPMAEQDKVVEKFEAVKSWVIKNYR